MRECLAPGVHSARRQGLEGGPGHLGSSQTPGQRSYPTVLCRAARAMPACEQGPRRHARRQDRQGQCSVDGAPRSRAPGSRTTRAACARTPARPPSRPAAPAPAPWSPWPSSGGGSTTAGCCSHSPARAQRGEAPHARRILLPAGASHLHTVSASRTGALECASMIRQTCC